jgi:hypothetical protein
MQSPIRLILGILKPSQALSQVPKNQTQLLTASVLSPSSALFSAHEDCGKKRNLNTITVTGFYHGISTTTPRTIYPAKAP